MSEQTGRPEVYNLHDVLENQFGKLKQNNPDVYQVLSEYIQAGFFEESQGSKAKNSLADQILLALTDQENDDEN